MILEKENIPKFRVDKTSFVWVEIMDLANSRDDSKHFNTFASQVLKHLTFFIRQNLSKRFVLDLTQYEL